MTVFFDHALSCSIASVRTVTSMCENRLLRLLSSFTNKLRSTKVRHVELSKREPCMQIGLLVLA